MPLILTAFLIFLFFPLTAWAYFDPGFGGYLINSIISLIVTGFAFVSASVIYFFRTIIGKRIFSLWQKHQRLCRTVLLLTGSSLGIFLFWILLKTCFIAKFTVRSDFDPDLGLILVNFILLLAIIGFAFASVAVIYAYRKDIGRQFFSIWQKYQQASIIILLAVLITGSFFGGPFLFRILHRSSAAHPYVSATNIIDPARICEGYDLFNGELIDENRQTLKRWANKDLGTIDKNGDYYGADDDQGQWGRYTWDDKIIWEKHFPIYHELYLSPKGTIFVFTRELRRYNNYKVDFDNIIEYDKNGRELQRFSFWDHLKDFQPYHAKFLIDAPSFLPLMFLWQKIFYHGTFDYFHINSFYMVPPNALEGKSPAFRPGNWLISIFHGSMVFILDQDSKKVLWHAEANDIEGGLEGQHSASMLPDGDILLFDNGISRRTSRVLIIDPLTLKIKWQYSYPGLFSPHEGYVQALPNNNFLVTESEKGYVFELTPDKKIVWEYYNSENRKDDIYRMTRYPKEMIDPFLRKDGAP